MRTIKMTNGTAVTLDGDLLSVIEALYVEVTAKHELERSFEDMVREIQHLIGQMTDEAWLECLDWCLNATFYGTRRALQKMEGSGWGRIIRPQNNFHE